MPTEMQTSLPAKVQPVVAVMSEPALKRLGGDAIIPESLCHGIANDLLHIDGTARLFRTLQGR